jgi:ABC-type nitrate/sulfonate/bicarbonate transport system permease component
MLGTATAVPIFNNTLFRCKALPNTFYLSRCFWPEPDTTTKLFYQWFHNLATTVLATIQANVVGTLHAAAFGARNEVKGFQRVV